MSKFWQVTWSVYDVNAVFYWRTPESTLANKRMAWKIITIYGKGWDKKNIVNETSEICLHVPFVLLIHLSV